MSKTYIKASLRKQVYKRAKGCCEYCLIPDIAAFAPHEVDHVIAEKHGGLTKADNLALSCALCNKHKGSDLTSIDPETGDIVPLYHPRKDQWCEHFQIKDAKFIALSSKARVTIRLLQLNQQDRIEEREYLLEAGMLDISKYQ